MQTSAEASTSLAPDSLSLYLSEISKYPLLSVEEERKLARQFLRHNLRGGHTLVTSNLRFVVKVADEYRSYSINISDLIQEGVLGLLRAVQQFDPAPQV